jgi:2-polyprenyl-3-methyl-5-hydroxy-6-metoxy-1,4-benzoquinol methylase
MFFFPLLLGRYNGENFQQLLQLHIEGIPVKLTASLLPWYSRFNLHALLHVYLNKKITSSKNDKAFVFTKLKMTHLLQGLQQAIKQLSYKPNLNTWGNYYEETILSKEYLENKKQLVKSYLSEISFKTLLDIGSNDGYFSLLATELGANVVSIDNDSTSINRLYNQCKTGEQKKLTALQVSIINPSPSIGWANTERTSFLHRAQSDVVLALALIHHLAIQHNIPLSKIAKLLSSIARYVIIEFVPKDDEKVLLLLKNRKDIFHDYSQKSFENEMLLFFTIETRKIVDGS